MGFLKKTSPRRSQLRKTISAERFSQIGRLVDTDHIISLLLAMLFVIVCIAVLSFDLVRQGQYLEVIPIAVLVVLISAAACFYICHYQRRVIRNHTRALALVGVFLMLLATAKLGVLLTGGGWRRL